MSISTFNAAIQQTAVFTHANSGYSPTQAGPTTNQFTQAYNSGLCYLKQAPIASGQTVTLDFVSGGFTDLTNDLCNFKTIENFWISPASGPLQIQTTQSGGMKLPQLGLSGGGFLLDPGAAWSLGDAQSGYGLQLSPTNGNLVFSAVSGGCLYSLGVYGI